MTASDRSHPRRPHLDGRPFSLTPDRRLHFFSRSHRRAFDLLMAGIERGDRVLLLTGDLGVGKTTLCQVLIDARAATSRTALVSDALLSADGLLRLMLQDLGLASRFENLTGGLAGASLLGMIRTLDEALWPAGPDVPPALVIVDEAQRLPASTALELAALIRRGAGARPRLQVVLAAQAAAHGGAVLLGPLDQRVETRVRLLPLDRDECGSYIAHRLALAGGAAATFSPQAVETVHRLSGGVPRLVNLIAERSLREAELTRAPRVDPAMVAAVAATHTAFRIRPRRFRWFASRAS